MKVLIAGYTGLVGSALFEKFNSIGEDVVGINSKNLDLLERTKVFEFVHDFRPDLVIDAAAIVGGIGANNSLPVDFLSKNLQMQCNLMDASHSANVDRFVFLGSSCIYPRESMQPIKEEYLLTGTLEPTNSAYAIAKIAGIELVKSYRKQYARKWISLMPTNMYGPRDNFDETAGHVLPALISKFVSAKTNKIEEVVLWGNGSPLREFLHSEDLADAVVTAVEHYDDDLHLNIGSGDELTIKSLAEKIAGEACFQGKIIWDTSKPNGTPRKILDSTRIKSLGWTPKISLDTGIKQTIDWFKSHAM